MKRKLIIALTLVLLAAFAIPNAFAAMTDAQKDEVESIYTQMFELRKQILQKYVEAGEITADEAKQIEERMNQGFEYKKSQGFDNFGPGGMMGGGMMGGGGGCGAGYGPNANTTPTANQL